MMKQSDGSWQATVFVPASASSLNTAHYNQSSVWDNNGGGNYNLNVSQL